uniref:Uncharacterized protein n=1 Tax=Meloidogyne hapla TaxID=6305 RepID=A0A1I8BSF2_MELHA
AKANFILRSLPHTERIVFRQCVINSEGKLNLLAKCMVSLFNVRDNFKEKRWRNLKFNKNELSNEEEWPIWTQLFKYNEISSITSKNPSKNFETKVTKIERNFAVFTNLMKGKDKKVDNFKNYIKEVKDEAKMRLTRMKQILRMNEEKKKRSRRNIKIKENIRKSLEISSEKSFNNFKNIGEKTLEKFPNVKQLVEIERFYDKVESCTNFIQKKEEQLNRLE